MNGRNSIVKNEIFLYVMQKNLLVNSLLLPRNRE